VSISRFRCKACREEWEEVRGSDPSDLGCPWCGNMKEIKTIKENVDGRRTKRRIEPDDQGIE
jgi:hypothetical protein